MKWNETQNAPITSFHDPNSKLAVIAVKLPFSVDWWKVNCTHVHRCEVLFCQCCSWKECCSSAFGVMLLMLWLYALPRCNVSLLLQIPQNCLLSHCCCFVDMSTLLPLFLPHMFISPSWWLLQPAHPTRVQISWFCCLCILVSLYVDLFTACSIMLVDASCSESEARFDPPAGVLQHGLCSRIDLWYGFHRICLQTPLQYVTWRKVSLQKSWYVERLMQNMAFIPQSWIVSNFQQHELVKDVWFP